MRFEFIKFGESLGTRILGKTIRNEIIERIEEGDKVTFDFRDVNVVSNSFADEVIGKLFLKYDKDFLMKNTNFMNVNSFVESVIKKAINDRLSLLAV